ncbi:MAG: hypothetical protein K6F23_15820 [Solobacterium sp.]|nr:hypothetical protein [Solobacterium sp.]
MDHVTKHRENIIRDWQEPVKAARDFLCELLEAMYEELPLPKKRKK